MDISFVELRCKEVINVINGKRMGRVSDIIINCRTCCVMGIVVPGERKVFKSNEDLFIPWKNIAKIGDDCVLVQFVETPYNKTCQPQHHDNDGDTDYCIEDSN